MFKWRKTGTRSSVDWLFPHQLCQRKNSMWLVPYTYHIVFILWVKKHTNSTPSKKLLVKCMCTFQKHPYNHIQSLEISFSENSISVALLSPFPKPPIGTPTSLAVCYPNRRAVPTENLILRCAGCLFVKTDNEIVQMSSILPHLTL